MDYVLTAGTTLGKGHQAWQMNEVNPLIWPSPGGIGITGITGDTKGTSFVKGTATVTEGGN